MTIRVSEASVTRPANTTQYTAGDVIGSLMSFSAEAPGLVRSGVLIDSAAEATKPDADLLLFDTAPTVAADNAAFAPTDDEMKRCIGVCQFAGANFRAGASGNGLIVATAFGEFSFQPIGDTIYGVLVARSAYTPVSEEVFTVRVGVITG